MQHRDVKFILGTLLAQTIATLWIGSAYATVSITSEPGQTAYFQRAELGPPQQHGSRFGASVAVWRDATTDIRWAIVGAPGDDTDEGAAYLFELVPGAEQWYQAARITPSDGNPGDGFGSAVAIQGNNVAIGAPGHTAAGHTKAGQAYLYTVDYTKGSLTAAGQIYGAASDNANSGTSIALAGNIVFIGAPNALTNGAVWVGLRSGTTWTYSQGVVPTGTLDGSSFGQSLAMDGTKLVVGMPNDRTTGDYRGLAFTFVNRGGSWSQEARLSAPDASTYNHFGSSVAIYADKVAVGARDHDAAKGAVYSFQFNSATSTWDYKSTLTQAGAQQFGFSVSLSAELLAVGAPGATDTNGAVYVFGGSPTTWSSLPRYPSNGVAGNYGASVVIDDGMLFAGAPYSSGAATSYTYDTSSVLAQRKIVAMGTAAEQFGAVVAISGDTAVIDAPSQTISGAAPNLASIFVRDQSGTWQRQSNVTRTGGNYSFDINFCPAAAIDADTMLIGDPLQEVGGLNQGGVFVWRRVGATWQRESNLVFLGGSTNDGFGCAVALSGNTAVVGAPGSHDAMGNSHAGSAYVFVRNGTKWTFQQTLVIPDGGENLLFGGSVGISGDTIVVGAPYNDDGALYIYTRNAGVWTLKEELMSPAPGGHFGTPVAIDGNTIVVAAPLADSNKGEVYIYTGAGASWSMQAQLLAIDSTGQFGASLSLQGNSVIVGQSSNNKAFTYERSNATWNLHATLSSSSGGVFGTAVGISHGNVIIGSPYEQGGRAYIFQDDGIFADGFE